MTVLADLIQSSDTIWELPISHQSVLWVPARIYATEALVQTMDDGVEGVFEHVSYVATLVGIVRYAYGILDGHRGGGEIQPLWRRRMSWRADDHVAPVRHPAGRGDPLYPSQ
jgi:hypothetical protein